MSAAASGGSITSMYLLMAAATRPPTKAAVSSIVQMYSSTISMTSSGMEDASPRSAIRKMGILSFRERMSLNRLVALAWPLSSPRFQSMRIAWIAESDTMTEVPSSADAASTTSMARPCSSSASARAARPSAVGLASSSSTTSARGFSRLMLRWIMSVSTQASRSRRSAPSGRFARRATAGFLDAKRGAMKPQIR